MRTRTKPAIVFALLLLAALMLAACATPPTPAPTAVPKVPQCTVTSYNGEGWDEVLGLLGAYGENPDLLVNGVRMKPSGTLKGDWIIVLASKPVKCLGAYIAATEQSVGTVHRVTLSGFKPGSPITSDDLDYALADVCGAVRFYEMGKLGFNGDIDTGGCNLITVVKTSRDDASNTCTAYNSASEAYSATAAFDLSRIKSIAVGMTSNKMSLDDAYATYCK